MIRTVAPAVMSAVVDPVEVEDGGVLEKRAPLSRERSRAQQAVLLGVGQDHADHAFARFGQVCQLRHVAEVGRE